MITARKLAIIRPLIYGGWGALLANTIDGIVDNDNHTSLPELAVTAIIGIFVIVTNFLRVWWLSYHTGQWTRGNNE